MTTIIIRNSTTTSHVPANGALASGELAVNVTDAKLWVGAGTASAPVLITTAGAAGPPGPPGPPGPAPTGVGVGGSCFPLWEPVLMADGREMALDAVRVSDWVDDGFGGANPVLALDRTIVGNRCGFLLDGHAFTGEHPHMRWGHERGHFAAMDVGAIYAEWGAVHSLIDGDGHAFWQQNVGLEQGVVTQMRAGDSLWTRDGAYRVRRIDRCAWPAAMPLGNLAVGGSGTYVIGCHRHIVTGWPNHLLFDHKRWRPIPRRLAEAA